MRDLDHGLLQQLQPKAVSAEHLEVLGQKCASVWREGRAETLTDAVIQTVKEAGLSPEQVRRVVEFANTDAFLREFRKESAANKIVDFGGGGPADPAAVLQALNHQVSQVKTAGLSDYSTDPQSKLASAAMTDEQFFAALSGSGVTEPYANPYADALEFRDKLAGAYEHLTSELSGLERVLEDASESVYRQVKQAAIEGYTLGQVVRAWHEAGAIPEETFLKVAFAQITPRLVSERVFQSGATVASSLEKTGSAGGVVDVNHPLVADFAGYCTALEKVAQHRYACDELATALGQITEFIKAASAAEKTAEKGLWGKARDAAAEFAPHAAAHTAIGVSKITGTDTRLPIDIGHGVNAAVKYAPHAALGLGAYHLYQRSKELSQNPLARSALSLIPFTDANRQEHQRRLMEAAGVDPMAYGY